MNERAARYPSVEIHVARQLGLAYRVTRTGTGERFAELIACDRCVRRIHGGPAPTLPPMPGFVGGICGCSCHMGQDV